MCVCSAVAMAGVVPSGQEVVMVRAFSFRAANPGTMSVVFDIDASVGLKGANHHDDVMLIQYMLAIWMAHSKDPKDIPIIIAAPVVKVDGICGKDTIGGIRAFELANPAATPDGRVDPFGANTLKILNLNLELFFAGGLRGPVPNLRVQFPPQLIRPLFRP